MRRSNYFELAEYLAACRKKKWLTQREVAEELKYSTAQFISNFERGRAVPPVSKLPKLMKILGLEAGTYIGLYLKGLRRDLEAKLISKAPRTALDRWKSRE